jgi:hypothetical protein
MAKPKVQVESIAIEKQALVQNSALIRVAFGIIGNTKRAYVNVETNGDQARFRVLKVLLDSPQLKAISKADFKMRQWLYKESIPFDMGTMLVSMKKIANIVKVLNEYRDVTRPTLIADFKVAYPELLKTAEQALGDEFNASQFVSVDKVEAEFSFDYKILGFEVPGSLKSVSAVAYQDEVEKAAAQIQSVTHEIEQAQRTLLLSLIDTLDDKLSEDHQRRAGGEAGRGPEAVDAGYQRQGHQGQRRVPGRADQQDHQRAEVPRRDGGSPPSPQDQGDGLR